jgi:glutamate N-acetyltransferase/amino-acid N-acetyltransferase
MTPGPGIARTPLPKGFTASGINCGVRRYRPDLGIIISDVDSVAAGVFTQNECKAASVLYSKRLTPSSTIRAIVTNSGQANAATGERGWEDNWKMAIAASGSLGCLPHQVLTASTGVIGVPLAIEPIAAAMPELMARATNIAEPFSLAILTTDLVPKTVSTEITLSGGSVRLTGICKGSGMIHPNMATMLGYLLTDAQLTPEMAQHLLFEATQKSFNMISVDGDTSTNDSNFLMANGRSGVKVETVEDVAIFKKALIQVSQLLAQAIARDGEGSTKLIEVSLEGVPSAEMARHAARGLVISPLIKTAIHGEDPNWGRIVARLGADKVPGALLEKMTLTIQGTSVFAKGGAVAFDRENVRNLLKEDTVRIRVNLHGGDFDATAWGCDLSRRYVEINTEYAT